MTTNNTHRKLGNVELNIIARLTYEKTRIITIRKLREMFALTSKRSWKIASQLIRKKILSPIKRGIYIFSPLEFGQAGRSIDEFLIASVFFQKGNYYIGYSTLYNYYGFSEQLFQTVYVLNTSRYFEKAINGVLYKFIKVKQNRIYGIKKIKIDNTYVNISSKERTLIDLIYFNKPIGGITKAIEIFKQSVKSKDCNIKKLIDYAAQFPIIKVRKLIGFIFDELQIKDSLLKPLIKSVQDTSLISLTSSRAGVINKKWNVIINDSQKQRQI